MLALAIALAGCTDELPSEADVKFRVDMAGAAMLVPDACEALAAGFREKEERALLRAESRKMADAVRRSPDEVVKTIDGEEYTVRELVARVYDDACPEAQAAMRAAGIQPVKASG